MDAGIRAVRVVDSHTGGEPTRVVIDGGPDLGRGSLAERVEVFRREHDRFRSAVVNEPRGSDVLVGALLTPPTAPDCAAGVIFFNNVGYLGMCGHGTIGVAATLARLGRLKPGWARFETPVGIVSVHLREDGAVSVENVVSWREAPGFAVDVEGLGRVEGDIAWGGNWFFLARAPEPLEPGRVESLTAAAWKTRLAVNAAGRPEVDHVEFVGPAQGGGNARNFVLCPGKAYDRSPCGTGTSAKVACLAAEGRLAEGEEWVQEGILGSVFRASYRWEDRARGRVRPTITGEAHVTAESELLLDPRDPFCWGIRS
jgi:4-hydroxyproline epimerase